MRRLICLLLFAVLALLPARAAANATIVIINVDGPGEGFNDATPAAPVGGNTGTTLGEQRLIAFQYAASIWGQHLDSGVTIHVQAQFDPLTCTATSAVLGAAGVVAWGANFSFLPLANTWYPVALVNKMAGADLTPLPDVVAQFNSNLNGDPACLGGRSWYLGLDTNHGLNSDLVTVLLHEFAHGLGFTSRMSRTGTTIGTFPSGIPDIYAVHLFDNAAGKSWPTMTVQERIASLINTRRVVFTGSNATAAVPGYLLPGTPLLRVSSPATIAGIFPIGLAQFGPALDSTGVHGAVAAATDAMDAAGPTDSDACSAITNAAAIAGKIALVDRGTCGFTVKAANVQAAGAIAMIVADNVAGSPPAALGGADPTITIPSVRLSLADGQTLRNSLAAGVQASLLVDLTVRRGADDLGRGMIYTPDPVVSGSSVAHWDTSAFRNLLMEPFINADLTHDVDLTLPVFRDLGWYPDADLDLIADDGADKCLASDLRQTVIIGSCNSGAANDFFTTGANAGCSISDLLSRCATTANVHGQYVACVQNTANTLKKANVLTPAEYDAVMSCTGSSNK